MDTRPRRQIRENDIPQANTINMPNYQPEADRSGIPRHERQMTFFDNNNIIEENYDPQMAEPNQKMLQHSYTQSQPYTYEIQSTIAGELRISNMERRVDNLEKMLRFLEELIRLKEEEKKNDVRIDSNKISDMHKKILSMEEHWKSMYKKLTDESEKMDEKITALEKMLMKSNDTKASIGEFYANKLSEIESIIKKNDILVESLVDDKCLSLQVTIDSKLEDILNLVSDMSKMAEMNEYNVVESKETIRTLKNDNMEILKVFSLLKEKSGQVDYVINQITEMKHKYNKLITLFGDQCKEEDQFIQKMLTPNINTNQTI